LAFELFLEFGGWVLFVLVFEGFGGCSGVLVDDVGNESEGSGDDAGVHCGFPVLVSIRGFGVGGFERNSVWFAE
jgi:hypothetical protein